MKAHNLNNQHKILMCITIQNDFLTTILHKSANESHLFYCFDYPILYQNQVPRGKEAQGEI